MATLEVQVPDAYADVGPLVADTVSLGEMAGANLASAAYELQGVAEGGDVTEHLDEVRRLADRVESLVASLERIGA